MDIKNPNDALKSGISMIHQELNPVLTGMWWTIYGRAGSKTKGIVWMKTR